MICYHLVTILKNCSTCIFLNIKSRVSLAVQTMCMYYQMPSLFPTNGVAYTTGCVLGCDAISVCFVQTANPLVQRPPQSPVVLPTATISCVVFIVANITFFKTGLLTLENNWPDWTELPFFAGLSFFSLKSNQTDQLYPMCYATINFEFVLII